MHEAHATHAGAAGTGPLADRSQARPAAVRAASEASGRAALDGVGGGLPARLRVLADRRGRARQRLRLAMAAACASLGAVPRACPR